ncbi:unnamed protein product [Protopolystoma xenopodis]|uniref:Uncharacterized protein n=1 Tax=Protopolystoma xenopodis TaxID=117903 RepID=A0A3S5BYN2_9PLAT|nr:unnamed protein product [Protopolystoma xenopodis]
MWYGRSAWSMTTDRVTVPIGLARAVSRVCEPVSWSSPSRVRVFGNGYCWASSRGKTTQPRHATCLVMLDWDWFDLVSANWKTSKSVPNTHAATESIGIVVMRLLSSLLGGLSFRMKVHAEEIRGQLNRKS